MKEKMFFPAVYIRKIRKNRYQAITAYKMISVLDPILIENDFADLNQDARKKNILTSHLAFLESLVSWPENITLLLNITTFPDLKYPLGGRISTTLLLAAEGEGEKAATVEALNRSSLLFALANNHFQYIEIVPVYDRKEVERCYFPFEPEHIVKLGKHCQRFKLVRDEDEELEIPGIGFLSSVTTKKYTKIERGDVSFTFPWQLNYSSDISFIAEAIISYTAPLWFQVRLRPAKVGSKILSRVEESLFKCEKMLIDDSLAQGLLKQQALALRQSITHRMQQLRNRVFKAGIFISSTTPIDEALISSMARMISPVKDWEDDETLYGGAVWNSVSKDKFKNIGWFPELHVLTPSEAACAFRLPHPEKSFCPGLPVKKYRTVLASPAIVGRNNEHSILVGNNIHRGHQHPVYLDINDRMRHMCILGQTGVGKSTLLEQMVLADIEAGRGICLIDPHGDLVSNVLNRYPGHREDDLVIVDFSNEKYVLPMNFLSWGDETERDNIIDDIYNWFDATYNLLQTGGPMFEMYYRSFMRLLLGDKTRKEFVTTIPDFIRLFQDEDFRELCMQEVDDPQIINQVVQSLDAGGELQLKNMAPYVTSKFGRFISNNNLTRMVGQEEMALDFGQLMNSGKVVLINLGRSRFGETISGLLASQIVSRFRSAAMKRIYMKPEERKDFILYVDEFQNIASGDFESILSEARKFRLGLVMANQYAEQIANKRTEGGSSVLDAILGNVGTIACFRMGVKDARLLEDLFIPAFNHHDLTNLPNYQCYVNLKTGSNIPISISMETIDSSGKVRHDKAERLRDFSMSKYAITVEEADKRLLKRDEKIKALIRSI
jgi:hypothetical protein